MIFHGLTSLSSELCNYLAEQNEKPHLASRPSAMAPPYIVIFFVTNLPLQ